MSLCFTRISHDLDTYVVTNKRRLVQFTIISRNATEQLGNVFPRKNLRAIIFFLK